MLPTFGLHLFGTVNTIKMRGSSIVPVTTRFLIVSFHFSMSCPLRLVLQAWLTCLLDVYSTLEWQMIQFIGFAMTDLLLEELKERSSHV